MADQNPPPQQGGNNVPAPLVPRRYPKHEHDGSTFIQKKNDLRLMCNFTFKVNSHSLLLDRNGNQVFVLSCGSQDGRIFKVPITYADLDTLSKVCAKIERFKTGFDAVLHFEVAKAGCLHSIVRSEIEEYKSNNIENQNEVIVLDSIGFKKIEGISNIYVVGPKQVITVEANPAAEERIRGLETLWMGPDLEDLRQDLYITYLVSTICPCFISDNYSVDNIISL